MFKNFVCTPKCAHAQGKGRCPRGSRGARRRMPRLPHGRAWNPRWQSMRRWRGKRERLDGPGPASPSTSARFLLLFLKKKSPAGIRRIKRCGIICENSSGGGSPIAFPHPWRPIPFALSTVRNGRVALPQERLPSAPLLTGLPPRCIAHWARSASPLRGKGTYGGRGAPLPSAGRLETSAAR